MLNDSSPRMSTRHTYLTILLYTKRLSHNRLQASQKVNSRIVNRSKHRVVMTNSLGYYSS